MDVEGQNRRLKSATQGKGKHPSGRKGPSPAFSLPLKQEVYGSLPTP